MTTSSDPRQSGPSRAGRPPAGAGTPPPPVPGVPHPADRGGPQGAMSRHPAGRRRRPGQVPPPGVARPVERAPRREVWSPPRAPGLDTARPYLPSPKDRRSGSGSIPGQRPAASDPVGFPPVRDEDAPRPDPRLTATVPQWWERYLARAIDTALYVIAWLMLTGMFSGLLFTGLGVVGRTAYALVGAVPTILVGIAYVVYDHRMHTRGDGRTLGKKALGLRLVAADGGPVDPAAARTRAILYPGVLVLVGPLGLLNALSGLLPTLAAVVTVLVAIPIVTDARQRTLPDRRAGTRVVKDVTE